MKDLRFNEFSPLSMSEWKALNMQLMGEERFKEFELRKFLKSHSVRPYYDQSDLKPLNSYEISTGSKANWNYHERLDAESTSLSNVSEWKRLGTDGIIISDFFSFQGVQNSDLEISFDGEIEDKDEHAFDGIVRKGFLLGNGPNTSCLDRGFRSVELDLRPHAIHQDIVFELVMGLLDLEQLFDDVSSSGWLDHLFVRTVLSTNYYQEILKLRCFRTLFSAVLKQRSEEHHAPFPIYTELGVGTEDMSLDQQLIRLTSVFTSAVLGGATDLEIAVPHMDADSRLYFRNISNLLREEAYLSKVRDPLRGSFYFERVGYDLSEKAWTHFQRISKVGGQTWLQGDYEKYQNLLKS